MKIQINVIYCEIVEIQCQNVSMLNSRMHTPGN